MRIVFKYIKARPLSLPQEASRPFIFYHVPRCGGTTLRNLLTIAADNTPRKLHLLRGTIYGQFLGPGKSDTLEQVGDLEPSIESIIADHLPWGSADTNVSNPIALTAIRDPADRLLYSCYPITRY